MKKILSNMGFVMQISGILMIAPIIISFVYNEINATIAFFITATAFFTLGFSLNALCERKDLNFKESSALIVLTFIILSIIGAIPYLYTGIFTGTPMHKFTDSMFESTSGFTTTGFSMIKDLTQIPKSIIFYRALTQLIGGIGIILILLVFFYPEEKLKNFSKSMGIEVNSKIKKTFLTIFVVYIILTALLILIGYVLGYKNLLNLTSLIFSAISTGGFSPVNNITEIVKSTNLGYVLITAMILGSCNFILLAGILKLKIKEVFDSEIIIYLVILIATIPLVYSFSSFSLFDSLFHVVSMMSTTGFGYLNLTSLTDNMKIFFTILMFIGGTSLSTAGGVKIFRIILILKSVRKSIKDLVLEEDTKVTLFGKEYTNKEIITSLIVIILMFSVIMLSASIFHKYGYNFVDSVFETTAAVSTAGIGMGIISPILATELKWLVIFLMILGRVEILSFFIIFSGVKTK